MEMKKLKHLLIQANDIEGKIGVGRTRTNIILYAYMRQWLWKVFFEVWKWKEKKTI